MRGAGAVGRGVEHRFAGKGAVFQLFAVIQTGQDLDGGAPGIAGKLLFRLLTGGIVHDELHGEVVRARGAQDGLQNAVGRGDGGKASVGDNDAPLHHALADGKDVARAGRFPGDIIEDEVELQGIGDALSIQHLINERDAAGQASHAQLQAVYAAGRGDDVVVQVDLVVFPVILQRGGDIRFSAQQHRGGKADVVAHQQHVVSFEGQRVAQVLRDGAFSAAAASQKADALCHQPCLLTVSI